jgi:hypothetical protein
MTNLNSNFNTSMSGLVPVKQDRYGLLWDAEHVHAASANDINQNNYFQRRVKNMTTDFETAAAACEDATKLFNRQMNAMLSAEKQISEAAKKTSGNVRNAANDLSNGLLKLEKSANFDKLDRYVVLLERAASAMKTLADIEQSGKLDKIIEALK